MPQIKNINIVPGQSPAQTINVSQNDVGREIVLNVKDVDGWLDLTGCTVTLAGTKPSGLGYTITCTIDAEDNHKVTAVTTKEMTDEYGSIASELKITSGNTVVGSANIILAVEKDPHPDTTTDGSIDTLIPEITVLVERIEAAVAKAEVLQESEAWAVGQRDGIDVDSDDPTYHNNSKYYKEIAESKASSASASEQNAAASASASAASASNATAMKAAAQAAKEEAEAAAEAAASTFAVVGNVAFTVLESGQVREIWTKEEA